METINTLLSELTYNDLDQWAGEKIRTRGKSYIKRVDGLRRTANDELAAWVSGTEKYATLVHLDEAGEHECFCTCPYSWGPCKHAVAVVLAAAQLVKQQEKIPLLDEEDDLYQILFNEQNDEADCDQEPEDQPVAGKEKKATKPKLRKFLDAKSREELLELLVTLAADYPQVERDILEAEQLKSGKIDPLVRALRQEIKSLTREPAWSNHWNDEGYSPDYSHVEQQFKTLLAAGHADVLLDLGDELWRRGNEQVEQSDDDGETASAIGECLDIVLQALPQSSLTKPAKLLWLIDRLLDDEFGLLHSGETALADTSYTKEHWREVAAVLEGRMDDKGKPKPSDTSGTYRRENLMNRLIHAYRQSGQPEKILPLMEKEVEGLGNYRQLADALLEAGDHTRARHWCIQGFARTVKEAPGTATRLQERLRLIAEAEGRGDLVTAYRVQEFFQHPSLERYKELKKAAEKLGCWPIVRAGALGYLETGQRPDLPGKKGATTWPLPEPEVCFPTEKRRGGFRDNFPDRAKLIDIAIFEKRLEDVVSLYQAMKKGGPLYGNIHQTVAKAVAKSHPEVALGIWRGIVDRLIAEVKPRAYIEAGGYLGQMRKVFETSQRQADWQGLLAELRRTHKAKKRLMEVLDSLTGTTKKITE